MAAEIDRSSIVVGADQQGVVADCHVGAEYALLHCTKNVNLGFADHQQGKAALGDALIFKGTFRASGNRNELIGQWTFGYIQVVENILEEWVYAGRLRTEGSMRCNLKAGWSTNPSIDIGKNQETTPGDIPFAYNPGGQQTTITPSPENPGVFNIEVKNGDNPSGPVELKEDNRKTKAPNYLFRARRDDSYVALLVAKDPENRILPLAHFKWHLVWHVEFEWSSPATKPRRINRHVQIDVGPSTPGLPSDARFAQLLTNPSGKGANEQDEIAALSGYDQPNRQGPVYFDFDDHVPEIPKNWFGFTPPPERENRPVPPPEFRPRRDRWEMDQTSGLKYKGP